MRLLYVEDDASSIELLQIALKRYVSSISFDLDIVASIEDAKQLFSIDQYAALVIDWRLPDGEGVEFAAYVRQYDQTIPIIFFSTTFFVGQKKLADPFAPHLCLEKIYTSEHINQMIRFIQ